MNSKPASVVSMARGGRNPFRDTGYTSRELGLFLDPVESSRIFGIIWLAAEKRQEFWLDDRFAPWILSGCSGSATSWAPIGCYIARIREPWLAAITVRQEWLMLRRYYCISSRRDCSLGSSQKMKRALLTTIELDNYSSYLKGTGSIFTTHPIKSQRLTNSDSWIKH